MTFYKPFENIQNPFSISCDLQLVLENSFEIIFPLKMNSVVLKLRRSCFAMLLIKTTNSQQVFPSCSSRTKVRLKQFSIIHGRQGQTVSRRSKPNSCTTLIGEQPNPWYPLLHQDLISRHRGAKLSRRYGSQGQLACYPWRTFYPLIDDPSIQYHRITMTTHCLCSICKSHS